MAETTYAKGLEGVVAAESEICRIDGEQGRLYYLGYSIQDLARYSNFEEATYLLLYGELPNREEMESFSTRMRASRDLDPEILDMVRNFPKDAHPMELLQSVVSYLSGYVQHRIQHSATCNCRYSRYPGWRDGWPTSWSSAGTTASTGRRACTWVRMPGSTFRWRSDKSDRRYRW